MPSVFLSHNSKDKPWVRKLASRLEFDGIKFWLDEAEMKIGDSLIQKISQGIEESEFIAAIISKNSINSSWVQKELKLAMTREIEERRVVVLPILIEKCDLPTFLLDKLYADFTDPNKFEEGYRKIISVLKPERKQTFVEKESSVPKNIKFDYDLLLTPSLEEFGIPSPISYIPFVETHWKSPVWWIERGDPILTYHLYFYKDRQKPRFSIFSLDGGEMYKFSETIFSPVSGLALVSRTTICRLVTGSPSGTHNGLIGYQRALPTILIPRDEPRWENDALYAPLGRLEGEIFHEVDKNVHNPGGDFRYELMRLGDADDDQFDSSYFFMKEKEISKLSVGIKEFLSRKDGSFIDDPKWMTCDYRDYRNQYQHHNDIDIDDAVEELRANSLDLRDKLVHLIKK